MVCVQKHQTGKHLPSFPSFSLCAGIHLCIHAMCTGHILSTRHTCGRTSVGQQLCTMRGKKTVPCGLVCCAHNTAQHKRAGEKTTNAGGGTHSVEHNTQTKAGQAAHATNTQTQDKESTQPHDTSFANRYSTCPKERVGLGEIEKASNSYIWMLAEGSSGAEMTAAC